MIYLHDQAAACHATSTCSGNFSKILVAIVSDLDVVDILTCTRWGEGRPAVCPLLAELHLSLVEQAFQLLLRWLLALKPDYMR
jgi:hypothetical protein